MIGYPHLIVRIKLTNRDMEMEQEKEQLISLIAGIAYQNTDVVVVLSKIFGLHFLQLKSVMQKCYVALSSCISRNLPNDYQN